MEQVFDGLCYSSSDCIVVFIMSVIRRLYLKEELTSIEPFQFQLPFCDPSNNVQEATEHKIVEQKQDVSPENSTDGHHSMGHDHDFMPVKKIISEKERMKLDEAEQSLYRSSQESDLTIVNPRLPLHIPHHLAAFAQHVGDVSGFPPARRDSSDKLSMLADQKLQTVYLK